MQAASAYLLSLPFEGNSCFREANAFQMETEEELREALAMELRRTGATQLASVAEAFAIVPRHRFVPEATLKDAYADHAISIKGAGTETLASISQPSMLARMLDLARVRPGDRILEIGTGSGYNAALLAQLTGPGGLVVTIEIEADLVQRARAALAGCGYENVRIELGNGYDGAPSWAPYDCIIVSARANDIAPAWWDQLRDGGRVVVPLDVGIAGEYAVGFERVGSELHSVGIVNCLFLPLRGGEQGVVPHVFVRSSTERYDRRPRPIASIIAVRAEDADPSLLSRASIVVARPATIFAITWA